MKRVREYRTTSCGGGCSDSVTWSSHRRVLHYLRSLRLEFNDPPLLARPVNTPSSNGAARIVEFHAYAERRFKFSREGAFAALLASTVNTPSRRLRSEGCRVLCTTSLGRAQTRTRSGTLHGLRGVVLPGAPLFRAARGTLVTFVTPPRVHLRPGCSASYWGSAVLSPVFSL